MSGEQPTGQDTPVVDNEAQTLQPEQQQNTGTTEAQTDGADGGNESPVSETVTLTKKELQEQIERATAKAAAKAERRAFREAAQQLQQRPQPEPQRNAEGNEQPQAKQVTPADIEAYLAQQKAAKAAESLMEKAEEVAERYPDILTALTDPRVPLNLELIEFCDESEVGVELAYYLAKNPAKAQAIARMSPLKAGAELTRLEAELKAKPKATPSRAPEPINPVGSRGSARASSLPSDDDDMETWARKERERVAKLGR